MTILGPNATIDCATGTVATAPATTDQQAASDGNLAAQQQAQQDAATLRAAIITLLQSCVGVTWPNLSINQKQALVVAGLYKFGALDKTLTVQPLNQWL